VPYHQEDAVTRNPTASPPASPWAGRLHLALTAILFVAAPEYTGTDAPLGANETIRMAVYRR